MPTVAKLVSAESAPMMKAAGYRAQGWRARDRRTADRDGPSQRGQPESRRPTRVNLSYGVVVPTLRDYRASVRARPFPFPAVDEALVWKEVSYPFPEIKGESTLRFPFRWALPDEEAGRLGELMRHALQEEALPGVQALFDTNAQNDWLIHELKIPGVRTGFEPRSA